MLHRHIQPHTQRTSQADTAPHKHLKLVRHAPCAARADVSRPVTNAAVPVVNVRNHIRHRDIDFERSELTLSVGVQQDVKRVLWP